MSRPRLHEVLASLFDHKDASLLTECLGHEDYKTFMELHGITMPVLDLALSFTHTSFSHEYQVAHQEKLEFLGDAVIQLILTEELFRLFPNEKEGRLSKLRSTLVNETTLALIARNLSLDQLIIVGKGEFKKNLFNQDTVLADTLEALFGQIYSKQGFAFAQKLLLKWLTQSVPHAFELSSLDMFDAKSRLQEAVLARYKKLPVYTAEAKGTNFEVKLWVNEELLATGEFSSKKNGEKELAQEVLTKNLI